MTARTTSRPVARISIGEVIRRLRDEFPDVSISKLRFLESEGLIEPERSPSGYRKFSAADLERLRYILSAQRDRYLPLKVIKEHLDAIGRGLEPTDLPAVRSIVRQAAPAGYRWSALVAAVVKSTPFAMSTVAEGQGGSR
jgi:DNA-binding transcriptional MerR regulator